MTPEVSFVVTLTDKPWVTASAARLAESETVGITGGVIDELLPHPDTRREIVARKAEARSRRWDVLNVFIMRLVEL